MGTRVRGRGGAPSLLLPLLPGLPQHGALSAIRRSFPLAPTFYQSGEELRSPAMVSWRYFRVSIGTESGREGKKGERAGSSCPGREGGWRGVGVSRSRPESNGGPAQISARGYCAKEKLLSSRSISSFPPNRPHLQSPSPLPAIERALA